MDINMLDKPDYKQIIQEIEVELKSIVSEGKVANYIPELAKVDSSKFAFHISSIDGENYGFGDVDEKFSIQSIAKVFSLTLAYKLKGEEIWKRVGVEPSGNPFNSLIQLEQENGIPRNPLINSGALVISDILYDTLSNPKVDLLNFIREITDNQHIEYNIKVANSEKKTGFRNSALINLMRSFGNINSDINDILDFYFHLCSVEMTVKELSKAFLLYTNHGKLLSNDKEIITSTMAKRINAIMHSCGFYDEAGEFSFKVGLPGKSGVGGGIAAIYPGKYSVAVWSPKLNSKGNSFLGMKALQLLTAKTKRSIF
jgi:glutaminase